MNDTTDIKALREAALKATKLNLNTAQLVRDNSDMEHECPLCEGNGTVDGDVDYCNIDGVALGVQFYGIGPEHGLAESYFRAATPETILSLLDQLEAERQRADMANQQYLRVVSERDDATDELEELKDELAELKVDQVPVAYLYMGDAMECKNVQLAEDTDEGAAENCIPLFTAPQKPVVLLNKFEKDSGGRMMLDGKPEPRIGFASGWNAAIAAGGIVKDGE